MTKLPWMAMLVGGASGAACTAVLLAVARHQTDAEHPADRPGDAEFIGAACGGLFAAHLDEGHINPLTIDGRKADVFAKMDRDGTCTVRFLDDGRVGRMKRQPRGVTT